MLENPYLIPPPLISYIISQIHNNINNITNIKAQKKSLWKMFPQ